MTAYGLLDRLLHRIALRRPGMQRAMAEIEARLFPLATDEPPCGAPVLITGLPRAGTTLLLEVLAGAAPFASHTYRDMPFILAPALWRKLSGGFRKRAVSRERAHGDGMIVDHDSAEAFEEVLWLAFWGEHYGVDRIFPWKVDETDVDDEFLPFYRAHMKRIVLDGVCVEADAPTRYVSKNNANIARLSWLGRHLPDARIVIPFRDPAGHIGSLGRQHDLFTTLHRQDRFAREYMAMIGHFEFGETLRPVDFDGWLGGRDIRGDAVTADFWAEYWIAAHRSILETAPPDAVFVSYDALCATPRKGLDALAAALDLPADTLADSAKRFREPTTAPGLIPTQYEEQARALHSALMERSIV